MSYERQSSHAGSWYTKNGRELDNQLQEFLEAAANDISFVLPDSESSTTTKALIVPHAGFSYSGPTAGYGYQFLRNLGPHIKNIFVLGPSHHVHLSKCGISGASILHTPIAPLRVNQDIRTQLLATGKFIPTTQDIDEEEHSIEMHLPFIAKILKDSARTESIQIVPIMVGHLSEHATSGYVAELRPFFEDQANIFVVSSDFCHWGKRFSFSVFDDREAPTICQFITQLDHTGMDLIAAQDRAGFMRYLDSTNNTICGRHPIALLLALMEVSSVKVDAKFVKYAQSSAAMTHQDSSVSYATCVVSLK